jgi:hypothetical protein
MMLCIYIAIFVMLLEVCNVEGTRDKKKKKGGRAGGWGGGGWGGFFAVGFPETDIFCCLRPKFTTTPVNRL